MLPYEPDPEEVEGSDLLLNLGCYEIINSLQGITDGYTVLYEVTFNCDWGDNLTAVIASGPDLHRRGFDTSYTPFEESSISLAMYSARVFSNSLHAFALINIDREDLID